MVSQYLASNMGVPATMTALVLSIPMCETASPAYVDTRQRGYQLLPERDLNGPPRRAPACQLIPSTHRIACSGPVRSKAWKS